MPRFYRSVLNSTLNQYVQDALDAPADEAVNLREELALMREMADSGVAMWLAAQQSSDPDTKYRGAVLGMQCLRNVAEMVKDCQSVSSPGALTAHDVQSVVNQITRIAHEAFGDDPMVHEFEKLLKTQLRVKRPEGTELTPDMDARMMDETVPADPEADG